MLSAIRYVILMRDEDVVRTLIGISFEEWASFCNTANINRLRPKVISQCIHPAHRVLKNMSILEWFGIKIGSLLTLLFYL